MESDFPILLLPKPAFKPKVLPQSFKTVDPFPPPLHDASDSARLHLVCPVWVLQVYVDSTEAFRQTDQLFVQNRRLAPHANWFPLKRQSCSKICNFNTWKTAVVLIECRTINLALHFPLALWLIIYFDHCYRLCSVSCLLTFWLYFFQIIAKGWPLRDLRFYITLIHFMWMLHLVSIAPGLAFVIVLFICCLFAIHLCVNARNVCVPVCVSVS